MREKIYEMWNSVMNADHNPLKHIPSLQTRHMILQILAWTWASSFALAYGSLWIWGFSMVAHLCIIAAIVVTVATFETAKRNQQFLLDIMVERMVENTNEKLWYSNNNLCINNRYSCIDSCFLDYYG